MMIWTKYNTARHIYIPIVKRGVVDFAVGADWTPAAGDVKISKDGGAAANVTNLPTAIVMGNAAVWDFSLTTTEMSCAQALITVADSATKAVEDQAIYIATYGNASAMFQMDLSDTVRLGLTALPNAAAEAAGGLYTRGTGAGQIAQDANGRVSVNLVAILGTALTETAGQIAAGFKKLFDVASPVFTLLSIVQTGDSFARLGAPAGASVSADVAAVKVDTAAVKVQTDKLTFTVANQVDSNVIDWKGATAPAMTGDAFARLGAPAGASVSADVAAINAKTTNLPSDPADQSDIIVATNAIFARLGAPAGASMSADTAAVKSDTAAIKAKTDNLPASPAATSDIPTAVQNADVLLDRDMSTGTDSGSPTVRTVRQALRFLRNKFAVVAGTLSVYKEDDSTASWTTVLTTDATADPITASDPAGP